MKGSKWGKAPKTESEKPQLKRGSICRDTNRENEQMLEKDPSYRGNFPPMKAVKGNLKLGYLNFRTKCWIKQV